MKLRRPVVGHEHAGVRVVRDRRPASSAPDVSVILLDWSVRERFHALQWLNRQTVDRSRFELLWIELHDRVVTEALDGADVLVTCGQRGLYHKHAGYNVGLLQARGRIVTVCDSDAVFPPDFIASVAAAFERPGDDEPRAIVLMHYERRTAATYPDGLSRMEDVAAYAWRELQPNVGACMSVRRVDALRFGGFDEHPAYRGYVCGPYELGWRLVNAGLPEIWHPEAVTLWHFAHPEPSGHFLQFSLDRWCEVSAPHVDFHAWKAVEAFSTGRLLPSLEHPGVHAERMQLRSIGTAYERGYATMTGSGGFSQGALWRLRATLWKEPIVKLVRKTWWSTAPWRETPYFWLIRWAYRKLKPSHAGAGTERR